jgi:hypothetical protein
MRKRVTRVALTLVVLASMSLTLGAGMRWSALSHVAPQAASTGQGSVLTPGGQLVTVSDVAADNSADENQ